MSSVMCKKKSHYVPLLAHSDISLANANSSIKAPPATHKWRLDVLYQK